MFLLDWPYLVAGDAGGCFVAHAGTGGLTRSLSLAAFCRGVARSIGNFVSFDTLTGKRGTAQTAGPGLDDPEAELDWFAVGEG